VACMGRSLSSQTLGDKGAFGNTEHRGIRSRDCSRLEDLSLFEPQRILSWGTVYHGALFNIWGHLECIHIEVLRKGLLLFCPINGERL
jgi:hypothetical protein